MFYCKFYFTCDRRFMLIPFRVSSVSRASIVSKETIEKLP